MAGYRHAPDYATYACRRCGSPDIVKNGANKLGVDVSQLPVVATAPEAAMEKAVLIGTWAVALGLPTHVGVVPPVTGSPLVMKVLTETAKELLGGYFIVEPDPKIAAQKMVAVLKERRAGLGI